jgi:hypothetical protein
VTAQLKQFASFAGSQYYPSSGIGNYVGTFATLEEAKEAAWKRNPDWVTVAYIHPTGDLSELYYGNNGLYG